MGKYEKLAGGEKGASRRYAKKEKSKKTRIAQKTIAKFYRLGLEERALRVDIDPKKGWVW